MPSGSEPTIVAYDENYDRPIRVAVLLADLGKSSKTSCLQYLLLRANSLQRTFQFELHPLFMSPALLKLAPYKRVERDEIEKGLGETQSHFQSYRLLMMKGYEVECPQPDTFIMVSLARFSDRWYSTTSHDHATGVLALGNWKRSMSPPTLVEFLYSNIIVMTLDLCCRDLDEAAHAGTVGCIADFTPTLEDAKFKVLHPLICHECQLVLKSAGVEQASKDVMALLDKSSWWAKDDPLSPASIIGKLGLDLFATKSLKPSLKENVTTKLGEEFAKGFLGAIAAILIAICTFTLAKLGISVSDSKADAAQAQQLKEASSRTVK